MCCIRIPLITPEPHVPACVVTDWLLEQPLAVAGAIENAFRPVADVQLDNGFPLMLGVADVDFLPL